MEQINKVELKAVLDEKRFDVTFDYNEGNEENASIALTTILTGSLYLAVCQDLDDKVNKKQITEESYTILMGKMAEIIEVLRNPENDDQPLMLPDEVFGPKYLSHNNLDNE